MVGILIVLVLLGCTVSGGIVTYRRTLASGPYSGSVAGALRLASVLGAFLGVSVTLVTILIVLGVRAAR